MSTLPHHASQEETVDQPIHPRGEGTRLFDAAMLADPYPVYRELRSTRPVYHYPADGKWYLSRYADVDAALRSPLMSSAGIDRLRQQYSHPALQPALDSMALSMVHTDAPVHTRLRGLVSKAFTPHTVAAMAARIQAIVDRLLDAVAPAGRMDVIHDLAYPLPVIVIAEMLGLPVEDRERLKRLCDEMTAPAGGPSGEALLASARARAELMAYFAEVVAQRRVQPRDDLLSGLTQATELGDRLSDAELYSNAVLLLHAGNENTTNLIGNGALALLRHPDQLQKLLATPQLIESAVEEFLRYDSPFQFEHTPRLTREDVRFGDVTVPRGAAVVLLLGAANRDPDQFPEPDRLDLTRAPNHHLAFGAGPHFCLGAALARLEARIALGSLLQRFPGFRLGTDPVEPHRYFFMRGLKTLPVIWS